MDTTPTTETSHDIALFVHQHGAEEPLLATTSAATTVRALIEQVGADPLADSIWVEDRDDALELDASLEAAGLGDRSHAHIGRCRTVSVTVRFNGTTRTHVFRPATTIARVFTWAAGPQGFNLPAEQRPKHALAVAGADHFLDAEVHIGSLADPTCREVQLDLLPKERFEG